MRLTITYVSGAVKKDNLGAGLLSAGQKWYIYLEIGNKEREDFGA